MDHRGPIIPERRMPLLIAAIFLLFLLIVISGAAMWVIVK